MIINNFLCVSTHTSPTRGYGGPSISFRNFLNLLSSKDIHYTLITTNPYHFNVIKNGKSTELFFPTLFFHNIGFSIFSSISILILSLLKNTIVINGITSIPNFSALIGSLFNFKSKVVVFARGSFEIHRTSNWSILKKQYYKLNLLIIKYLIIKNRLIIVFQSQSEKEKSFSFCKQNCTINGNIDELTFEKMKNKYLVNPIKTKENDLVFVGRYSYEKGIDRLIKILKILKQKNSRLKIVLIFDTLDKKKISKIRGFVDGLNCQIFVNLENEIVLEKLSKSKLIFFPSYVENYGNVLVEAVIMGAIPVLYNNTHWWEMYPEYSYDETDLINFINKDYIIYDKELSKKCIDYIYSKNIKNNSFESILNFIF